MAVLHAEATVLYNCVLLDDGPVRPEICRSWCVVTLLWFY